MLDVSITQHFRLWSRAMHGASGACLMRCWRLEALAIPFSQLRMDQLLFIQDLLVYFIFNML